MFENNKILVIIPAKEDSTNIPRKNSRILGEHPLVSYSINIANSSKYVDDVVVSTDDDEIKFIAEKFGCHVIKQPVGLPTEEESLEAMIFRVVTEKEKFVLDEYNIVIIMGPSTPLLRFQTLDAAIEKFNSFDVDSVISVKDNNSLTWGYNEENNKFYPLYSKRENKKELPTVYEETGIILATRRPFISDYSFLGNNIDLIRIPRGENLNIEYFDDLWIAEKQIKRKRIAIKVDAYDEIGTDYIYRCILIASKLINHDILFILNKNHTLGINILNKYNFPFVEHGNNKDLHKKIDEFSPDIIINDILNTSLEYIQTLKEKEYFVVNFEDLGEGSEIADLVFDDLYKHDASMENVLRGESYFILKEEYFFQNPKIINPDVNHVLVKLDGSNYDEVNEQVLEGLISSGFFKQITVILGRDFQNKDKLKEKFKPYLNISIFSDVNNISDFILSADLVITSPGKTIYEAGSLGVPSICLYKNEFEFVQTFANQTNGFIHIGVGPNLNEELIKVFTDVISDYELRSRMNRRMLSVDLKYGLENISYIIQSHYRTSIFKKKSTN